MSTGDKPGPTSVTTLLLATLSTTLGALPVFLVGALAVLIREELGFSEARLGALVSIYYVSSALTSVPGGRLAERLGGRRAMGIAAVLTLWSMLGISVLAHSWAALAFFLVSAGVANGVAFPASNLALTRGFPLHRQGVGFAVKQSAGPYATLLAGASVPAIGLTVGWRWAFVVAGLATVPVLLAAARGGRDEMRRRTARLTSVGPLTVLAAGGLFAVMASSSLGAFYVESAVADGIGAGVAGTFLALGSLAGVGTRFVWGWLGDRHPASHFTMLPILLGIGALGFAALGAVEASGELLLVTVLVFTTGWAWPSLLSFAVVLRNPETPAAASGIIGTGQFGGGIIGPFTFGLIVEGASFQVAWSAAAGAVAVAGLLMLAGGRWLDAGRFQPVAVAQ